jgi:hypothetical protein
MTDPRTVLLVDTDAKAYLSGTQSAEGHQIEPRFVEGGEYAGNWILGLGVLTDDAHLNQRYYLDSLPRVVIVVPVAFPPSEE